MQLKGKNQEKQRRAIFAKANSKYNSYSNSPTILIKDKNNRLKRTIRIESPSQYRQSVRMLKKGGLTKTEKQALILAQNRAKQKYLRTGLQDGESLTSSSEPEKDQKEILKVYSKKGLRAAVRKKREIELKKKDTDKDGVSDYKDCQPYNPKKQGILHDWQMKRLKKQEQKLEEQRKKIEQKTETQREILDQKMAVSQAKENKKKALMQQKQSVIDEINKEKQRIKDLKEANRKAKQEIFNKSPTGKVFNFSKGALNKTNEYFKKPSTKKAIKKFLKKIG